MKLILENNMEIDGYSFGADSCATGEIVFNTSMTGYPESLTDPSYKGQILVLTYPLIGNYGVPSNEIELNMLKNFESDRIHISGLVIADYSFENSHWNSQKSLGEWLREHNIPAIGGVDTRKLTKLLRDNGTMLGKMIYEKHYTPVDFYDTSKDNLVAEVSCKEKIVYGDGKHKIMLVDCGVKNNIIRHLLKRDTTIIRVPWDYDFTNDEYDALFISNGPGDPKKCGITINNIRKSFSGNKPIFGICLGNQLMCLAAGGDTYKLKFGHRSHNQPVLKYNSDRCYITSQNHGYANDIDSLHSVWEPFFTNVNDNTNEGIKHKSKPFFSTQFHPEASSGPTDTDFLFDDFIKLIK